MWSPDETVSHPPPLLQSSRPAITHLTHLSLAFNLVLVSFSQAAGENQISGHVWSGEAEKQDLIAIDCQSGGQAWNVNTKMTRFNCEDNKDDNDVR